jgi:hypothetical protein
MTTPLSPAAQAVMDAIDAQDGNSFVDVGVAVLIAAADQLREAYANEEYVDSADDWLDDIATELENR